MPLDSRKKSVEIVKQSKPRSTNHKVISQDTFLDGFVSKVNYQEEGDSIFLWVVFTSRFENHAEKESQLIQQMDAAVGKHTDKWGFLKIIFNITGWLAVILIGVSAYLLIKEKEVPEFLKASFLTVIGFYFGGLLNEKKPSD